MAAQPLAGVLLVHEVGYSVWESWILASIVLYIVTGLFWLPVVRIQVRMHDLAAEAAAKEPRLPREYPPLFQWWLAFGFPAFFAVLAFFLADDRTAGFRFLGAVVARVP